MATPALDKDLSLSQLGESAYEVIIPPDSLPGDILRVNAGGKDYKIVIPEGAEPGMALVFEGSKNPPGTPRSDSSGTPRADETGPAAAPPPSGEASTPRAGSENFIETSVAIAKNIGRHLSFQRRRKPMNTVPADAIRMTKVEKKPPVVAAIEAVGDKLPAELAPALADQFPKVPPKDKTYFKFAVPAGWANGVEVEVEMPSRLKLHWTPPPGTAAGAPCAFLVPRSESIAIESGNDDLKRLGDVVDEEGLLGAAVKITKNIGRHLSFDRRRRPKRESDATGPPAFKEVDVYKPKGESLGLSLAYPADTKAEGVIVTSLLPGGVVAKGKRVRAGDSIHAVNGVKVTDVEQATAMLKQAEGIIQLVITRASKLPKGWAEKSDGGATYWVHAASETKSYAHPAAIRHNADDTPVTLGDRFRGAVRKISLIKQLAQAADNEDAIREGAAEASEPAFVQVQRTTRI